MTERSRKLPSGLNVSRETFEKLCAFESLVAKWSPKINLVSRGDLDLIWQRHIVDSAQIFQLAPGAEGIWADIGSGGGFPAIVAAVLSAEFAPDRRHILIESDQRKATFLRTAVRELDLGADVISQRIEQVEPLGADILSARALASLDDLLAFAERHLGTGGIGIFPKGRTASQEVENARKNWGFDLRTVPSITDTQASILIVGNISREQS